MRFRTKDEIRKHLASQRSSGMTISAYCRQGNISQSTFFNWQKRFPEVPDAGTSSPVSFIRLPALSADVQRIDLTLSNGTKISAPFSCDMHIMREVIRLLAPLRARKYRCSRSLQRFRPSCVCNRPL